ncbi:uncharacterized protein LAESUDRAFT_733032, partial [Laetiporus sulphureus 93-53]
MGDVNIANPPAPRVPYYTPAQYPASGTAVDTGKKPIPTLFQPLKIRGLEFHNRICVNICVDIRLYMLIHSMAILRYV